MILRDADRPLTANWYAASDGDLESCLLTVELSSGCARTVGDCHEACGNNPQDEKDMDLHNNARGREIGEKCSSEWGREAEHACCYDKCKAAMEKWHPSNKSQSARDKLDAGQRHDGPRYHQFDAWARTFAMQLIRLVACLALITVMSCDDSTATLSSQFAPVSGSLERVEILKRVENGTLIGISREDFTLLCGESITTDKYPEYD